EPSRSPGATSTCMRRAWRSTSRHNASACSPTSIPCYGLMRSRRNVCLAVALALSAAARPGASATPGDAPKAGAAPAPPPPSGGGPFEFGSFGKSKEPVTVISDTLEYDYKANVVVYRGNVVATQAATKLTSDVLTITMDNDKQNGNQGAKPKAPAAAGDPPADPPAEQPPASSDTGRVQVIVATGNVRI